MLSPLTTGSHLCVPSKVSPKLVTAGHILAGGDPSRHNKINMLSFWAPERHLKGLCLSRDEGKCRPLLGTWGECVSASSQVHGDLVRVELGMGSWRGPWGLGKDAPVPPRTSQKDKHMIPKLLLRGQAHTSETPGFSQPRPSSPGREPQGTPNGDKRR